MASTNGSLGDLYLTPPSESQKTAIKIIPQPILFFIRFEQLFYFYSFIFQQEHFYLVINGLIFNITYVMIIGPNKQLNLNHNLLNTITNNVVWQM